MVHGKSQRCLRHAADPRLGIPATWPMDRPVSASLESGHQRGKGHGASRSHRAGGHLGSRRGRAVWRTVGPRGMGDGAQCLPWSSAWTLLASPSSVACSRLWGGSRCLTGQMAVRYIQGVQRHPIVATAKHYNVNSQEENRLRGRCAARRAHAAGDLYAAVRDGSAGRSGRRGHGRV